MEEIGDDISIKDILSCTDAFCLSSNGVHIIPDFQIFEYSLVHHKRINMQTTIFPCFSLSLKSFLLFGFDKWLCDFKPGWSKRCFYIWYKNIFTNAKVTPCHHPSLFKFKRMVWNRILSFLSIQWCFCLLVHCHRCFCWLNAKTVAHTFS